MKDRALALLAVLLACLGSFIALTLSVTEARGAIVPCGGSSGCSTVAESAYSHFLGYPLAYFGVAGYLLCLALTLWSMASIEVVRWVVVATGLGFLTSCALLAISALAVHATCLWCLGSAAMMTGLFVVTLLRSRARQATPVLAPSLLAAGLLVAGWFGASSIAARAPHVILNPSVLRQTPFADLAPAQAPSLGPATAPVTIVEFADFACPACRDIEKHLALLFRDTDSIRLVFRNLPQPFLAGHDASGYGAICGEVANEHGKFWEFAEQAFTTPGDPIKTDYDRILGTLSIAPPEAAAITSGSIPAVHRIDEDLTLAHKLGISVTPVFIVFSPGLPPQVGTNADLSDILRRPEIIGYLTNRRR